MNTTERVKKLREKVNLALYKPSYCIERAYWMTKSYIETESEPTILRRAKALKKILENMTIGIDDGELIVGKATSKKVGSPLFPELVWNYLEELVLSDYLTEEERAKLKEIIPYWKGKSLGDLVRSRLPKNYMDIMEVIGAGIKPLEYFTVTHLAHCCPNYELVITKGLNWIKKQVEEEIAKLDLTKIEDVQKLTFLKAVDISIEATIAFAKRYAALAKSLAEKEADAQRRDELENIARICEWVPANPARSFHEALQSLWFVYICLAVEGLAAGISFGRMDQYLYPFYKKDLEEGKLTKEQARELIALFYIKMNELAFHFPGAPVSTLEKGVRAGSETTLSVITLGGVTREGLDATNELSYLFLEAEEEVKLLEEIAVRVHPNTPEDFLIKACEVAKKVTGKIKFVCDPTVIKQLVKDGKTIEDARDYAITGCFIRTVPGRSHDIWMGGFPNLPLALELALNNGVSRLTGKQIGPKTGDPRKFKSYNELWNAYKTQVEWLLRNFIVISNFIVPLYSEFMPYPLLSSLFNGCIKKGKDITSGGALYNTGSFWAVGIPNVGDSLAAVKKVVFEDKKISMDRLIEALEKNFEGYEDVEYILKRAPKFGNDNDYVDSIVNDVLVHLCDEVAKYEVFMGRKLTVAAANVVHHIFCGKVVGALPDGRKAGEPFADGGLSPYYGRNVNGITSTMRSVAKLELWRASGGNVLNIKFNPNDLKEEFKIESKMRKFASLIKTFVKIGGDLVQFSFVNAEMLRDAQRNPEKYRDLLVRVATYSAYFVDIPREIQEDLIRRTEIGGSW